MSHVPVKRVFNAMRGDEIIDIILKEFRAQLEDCDDLRPHITYPIVEWTGDLKVRAYPRTPESFEVHAGGELVEYKRTPENGEEPAFTQKELGDPVTMLASTEAIVDNENPPDKVRQDNDLPVSIPEKGTYKTVVDRPRIRPRGEHHKVGEGD